MRGRSNKRKEENRQWINMDISGKRKEKRTEEGKVNNEIQRRSGKQEMITERKGWQEHAELT